MFTQQEQKAILFLTTVALIGLGINFALKANSSIGRMVQVNDNIIKINLNQASLEDLKGARVVTPKLASRIIEYRDSHGPFKDLLELKEIKGIGDYRYGKLKELFYVQ